MLSLYIFNFTSSLLVSYLCLHFFLFSSLCYILNKASKPQSTLSLNTGQLRQYSTRPALLISGLCWANINSYQTLIPLIVEGVFQKYYIISSVPYRSNEKNGSILTQRPSSMTNPKIKQYIRTHVMARFVSTDSYFADSSLT